MQSLCSISVLVPFTGMYEASDYIPYGVECEGIVGNQIWNLSAYTRVLGPIIPSHPRKNHVNLTLGDAQVKSCEWKVTESV